MAVIAPGGRGRPRRRACRLACGAGAALIDRNAAVGAVSERTRAGGMAIGVDGDPPLAMELGWTLTDVAPGDVIVASGVDGIYPKGFTIGTVETSARGPSLRRRPSACVRRWISRRSRRS